MKKNLNVFVLFALFTSGIFAQQAEKKYESLWEGKLKINTVELRLVFKLYQKEDKTYGADLDSPDQGVTNIQATFVAITKDSVKFEIKSIGASFSGELISEDLVKGIFKQGGMSLPLELVKVDKLAEVNRPQLPKKPFPYNEEEITFENKEANITLAGTLTLPKCEGKFPAVVLVTGSGPQDRDESLLGHKPFLVIADYLTRSGIAVLRFDDRGVGKSKGDFAAASSADFATDALAAVEHLKTRKEINPNKIGIVGHSEGGMIAPMCAVNSSDVAFIVLLAGTGVSGKDIIILQTELILKANGTKEEDVKKTVDQNTRIFNIIAEESDSLQAFNKLLALYNDDISKMSDEEKKKPENSKETFNRNVKRLLTPWFRFFIKYDPQPTLEQVSVPVLALNGGKDLQVDPKQNLPKIEKALNAGDNKNFKIMELPGLNHLFQPATTGAPSEYSTIETTFSEDALKIMKEWILSVTK
ncbi:MAG: alpha/beta hydrolase fold protein [Ignavibacteria bacterium]|nr:MAG: alpha/beta hydrolase fold protein [Ignavibacteria bacterium]KAF0156135.1 MAG: alpha/beta hydrolase fold protein [Ignavibacteria bacterium]